MTQEVLIFPTSFAQRRLWFLDQIVSGRPVYNVATEIDFDWAVPREDFARALDVVVRRHEALRTTFAVVDGEPVQVVHDPQPMAPSFHDLSALGPAARNERYSAVAAAVTEAPFDLTRGPLVRAGLVRTAADRSVAILVMHHIVTDGWSAELLEEEIVTACEALRRQGTPELPDVAVQYGDFAVWQRQHAGTTHRDQLAWWTQALAGAPTALSLPLERARPATPTFDGMSLTFRLPARLTGGIKTLARRSGATPFMAMLAAFEFLLSQQCGASDLVVGTPVAGRSHPALDRTVGFFVNTLALRTRMPDRPTFTALLEHVRDVAVEAYARQDVPFEQVVTELAPDRQTSITPLFQVMFTFDAGELDDDVDQGDHGVEALEIGPALAGTAKFDLTLALAEAPDGLSGVLEFNADVFTEATMRTWVCQYHALLEHAISRPDTPLTAEALMPAGAPEVMLDAWNRTHTAFPRHSTIHDVFQGVVARHGARVAVVDGQRRLTYRDLDARSDTLAAHLRARGVGTGALVGVCLDRSLELVVALLATLKCGGAYVPLDPDYPSERLRMMVEDTGLSIVLSTAMHATRLRDLPVSIVDVESTATAPGPARPTEGPDNPVTADDLAYVIYTSGSTGRPKGVEVSHRAVVRLVCHTDYVTLGPDDVMGHASNTSFDAATFEIWGALLNGARLVVIARDLPLSPRDLVAFLRAQAVTTLFVTTPLFNQIAAMDPASFGGLRDVFFGGDVVDPGLVRRVLQSGAPPARLLHVYGPSEATTFATWHHVREVSDRALTVPIGRPIANTTAYVLDGAGRPVPVGVAGELYIGGDGVARGYLGLPEATAARFVPNPLRPRSGERLYRTGDLARWLPDGAIEFLGRVDRQVKIRGFRVEPAEVEIVLTQCPGVAQVAVEPKPAGTGRHLVAYVAARPETDLSSAAVRAFARDRLPAYMVPSAFVMMDALPLNANGKIDRDALPSPDAVTSAPAATAVLPRTELEEAVANVWRAVLQRAHVSVEDNFFDLGGHSLLLIQVLERLRPLFPVELGVLDLFRYPTIAALGEELAGRMATAGHAGTATQTFLSPAVDDRAAQLRRAFSSRPPG